MGLGVTEPGVCVPCLLSSHRLPWSHASSSEATAPILPHLFQVSRVGNDARLAQGEFFHLFSGHSFKDSYSVISPYLSKSDFVFRFRVNPASACSPHHSLPIDL